MDKEEFKKQVEAHLSTVQTLLEQTEVGDEHAERALTFLLGSLINFDNNIESNQDQD